MGFDRGRERGTSLRARQLGAAILDVILAIAIFLIITAGVIAFFLSGSTAANANDVMNEIGAIQTVVQSLYAGQPNYEGLSASVVAGSNQLSTKWVANATTLASAYGPVTMGTVAPYTSYFIDFADVSQSACEALLTKDLGTVAATVSANSQVVAVGAATPAEAAAVCTAGDGNIIGWTFSN
jgi:hypothetical protein